MRIKLPKLSRPKFPKRITKVKDSIVTKSRIYRVRVVKYINRYPLRSFFIALGIVLVLIIISNLLPKPKTEITKQEVVKSVDVYRIGHAPKISVTAQIKKSGVIQINSLTPGVVSAIHVTEGSVVKKGTLLLEIASNYYGGNTASVSRQIAQKQYDLVNSIYPTQKELIQKQKDLANRSDENSDQLRDITSKSNDETNNLISQNETILATINIEIQELQVDPVGNRDDILSLQQLKSQYTASTNAARASLRSTQYQSDITKPPTSISDITREIALKQLDIQEKQLDMNKEISNLQLALARVSEGMYFPVAPFSGTVQRVFVKQFETVNPGTPLMILSQVAEEDPITAVAFVSKDIAQRVSIIEPSVLHIDNQTFDVYPSFVSTEAVQGSLYAVYYPIPDSFSFDLVNEGFITVDIPVGYPNTGFAAPFVPIDSIYQTRTNSYLYVVEGNIAKNREVSLGQVYGRFVEIESGLKTSDVVILNRNVIDGDKVTLNK
jgi:multidrug efflux pump subunit AcrA (membrane-fusion protein)